MERNFRKTFKIVLKKSTCSTSGLESVVNEDEDTIG